MIEHKAFFQGVILCVWLVLATYIGIGGFVKIDLEQQFKVAKMAQYQPVTNREGDEFFNIETLKVSIEEERFKILFPFIPYLPSIMAFLLTASAFGILGSLTRIFEAIAIDKIQVEELKVISLPILGGLTGILVLGMAYLIPSILVQGDGELRNESLIFICLFGGLFSEHFFEWLKSKMESIFPLKN